MSESLLQFTSDGRSDPGPSVGVKLALVVGFLALAAGILQAHGAPATEYELSTYTATPIPFWVGVGVAMLVSVAVAASTYRDRYAGLALALGGGGVLAVVSLPVLRGYFYYGAADSLTHLGWARELLGGLRTPLELVYPAGHLFGGATSLLLGVDLRHALMLVVPAFVLVYFVFSALTVRALVPERGAAVAGGFVAFLLLPVFNVGSSLMFVSFTLGLLFVPAFLYLVVLYTGRESRRIHAAVPITGLDLALFGTGVALLWLHPQLFSDVLVVLASVAVLQAIYRHRGNEGTIPNHRRVFGQLVLLSVLFVAWNANFSVATTTVRQVFAQLTGSAEVGAIVQQRGASLTEIGAGLPVLFVKLFLVNVVVAAFAAWVLARSLRDGTDRPELDAWARYLALALPLLGVYALLHFFGDTSEYFFRHLGFVMVVTSLLGAVGVYFAGRAALGSFGRPTLAGRGITASGVLVGLVAIALSLAIVFPSPYIYNPSHHVTEATMDGHEATFEHQAAGVDFAGIRGGANRFADAIAGGPELFSDPIYGEEIRDGLGSRFETDHYVIVTELDRQREVRAYDELRVTREDFRRLRTAVGVSMVMSNGDVDVYYVESGGSS